MRNDVIAARRVPLTAYTVRVRVPGEDRSAFAIVVIELIGPTDDVAPTFAGLTSSMPMETYRKHRTEGRPAACGSVTFTGHTALATWDLAPDEQYDHGEPVHGGRSIATWAPSRL